MNTGDTCFSETHCAHVPGSDGHLYFGHLDNFSGVASLMNAYFSSKLPQRRVHCKITYGEEKATNGLFYAGARDVMTQLKKGDFVAVIDVTGASARELSGENVRNAYSVQGHVIVEKVRQNPVTKALLKYVSGYQTAEDGFPLSSDSPSDEKELAPYTFETYTFCDDPQAFEDETDAYREIPGINCVFLGIPTCGGEFEGLISAGDYNSEPVFCWKNDIEAMTRLITDMSNAFIEHYDDIMMSIEEATIRV